MDVGVSVGRVDDINALLRCIRNLECCSVVGISNIGKSTLLRSIAQRQVPKKHRPWLDEFLIVYVDFNNMVENTEQGFCELILRSIIGAVQDRKEQLASQLSGYHQDVITPPSSFSVLYSFSEGLTFAVEHGRQNLFLILDEFDEPYGELEKHVFLNLRALKDRYTDRLCYVVATDEPLEEIRDDPSLYDFYELFAHSVLTLHGLTEDDSRQFIAQFAHQRGKEFDQAEVDFVLKGAGGHPGWLSVLCRAVSEKGEDTSLTELWTRLRDNPALNMEYTRLWKDLSLHERGVLKRLAEEATYSLSRAERKALERKSLLAVGEDRAVILGGLFRTFVLKQEMATFEFDDKTREVWVEGQKMPSLTQNEYRLLHVLYQNINAVVSKETIADAVWPRWSYDVADAAIESLVYRLRRKLEPKPQRPRYIVTMRGQGYKLVVQE
jgi:hypothetical protein